ncbi:MAG: AI-2E family transporter [Agromyces sp.]
MTESPRQSGSARSAASSVREEVPRGVRIAAAWSWRLLLIAALVGLALWLIIVLRHIVIPVLIGVLVAALLRPIALSLERLRWPRWLAVVTVFASLLIVVAGLLTLWVSQIARASGNLVAQSKTAWANLATMLADSPLHLSAQQLDDWFNAIVASFQTDSASWVTGAMSVGVTVTHVFAGLLLTLFSTLFFLIDGRGIWRWILGLVPQRAQLPLDGAGQAGWATLTSFVRVQILVAFIDGLGIGVGAALLGVPLAIPIGIMVFLGSFVPIVGAVVTGAIASFIALVYCGPWIALALLGVVLLVQQVEGHVLQPLVMGSAVKVHPLAVVLVVAAGSLLGGIAGALFAVPVAATLNAMIGYLTRGAWRPDAPPPRSEPLWSLQPRRLQGPTT